MTLGRSLGLGRLVYWTWHSPRAEWRRIRSEGGIAERLLTLRCRSEMRRAARRLPRLSPSRTTPHPTPVCFLTGGGFWDQTAFCAYSLTAQLDRRLKLLLIDDGTLCRWQVDAIAACGADIEVLGRDQAKVNLERALPAERFPRLHEQWSSYINIRKLTDPHLVSPGWKLVLDSDMLFHRKPVEIDAWLSAPSEPLVMRDASESYGYPRSVLEGLAGHRLAEKVNVGVTGLDSGALDWEKLECWIDALFREHGTHYYLEQALVAMLTAHGSSMQLDGSRYRVMPGDEETASPTAILHHYVAESRIGLYRLAWRHIARS